MSVQAAIEAELPRLRAEAEARMTTVVEIGTLGPPRYDTENDVEVRELLDSFTTKARIRVRSAQQVRDAEAGDRRVISVQRELHIPVSAPPAPVNAVARVLAVDPTSDPTLLGAELILAGPATGDQTTARRLLVEEVLT